MHSSPSHLISLNYNLILQPSLNLEQLNNKQTLRLVSDTLLQHTYGLV